MGARKESTSRAVELRHEEEAKTAELRGVMLTACGIVAKLGLERRLVQGLASQSFRCQPPDLFKFFGIASTTCLDVHMCLDDTRNSSCLLCFPDAV